MKKRLEIEEDLLRRLFLRRSVNTAGMLLIAALSLPAFPVLADDGESDGEGEGESDGDSDGEGSDGDSGGESGSGHGGEHGSGNSGRDHEMDNDDDETLDQSDAARAVDQGEAISLKAALNRVEDAYGGAVIDVKLRSTGRRLEYSFKIRTDRGRVRTIRMDAKSGRFLGLGSLFR